MNIAIIAAMEDECLELIGKMKDTRKETHYDFDFFLGSLEGTHIILLKSGIGKVNAALATSILIQNYHPACIINTGSAGGFSDKLKVGDLVVAEQVLHHDVDLSAFGYNLGQVPLQPKCFNACTKFLKATYEVLDKSTHIAYQKGIIASGDQFIHKIEDVQRKSQDFPDVIACDMEAAAIGQTCHLCKIPFITIRAISDFPGQNNVIVFKEFLKKAVHTYSIILPPITKKIESLIRHS